MTGYDYRRRAKCIVAGLWLVAVSVLPEGTLAQSAHHCKVFGGPQADPALVRLDERVSDSVVKRGKRIHVVLTLRAGAKGVLLPDFFRSFNETCSHGFSVEFVTSTYKLADPAQAQGCAYVGGPPVIRYVALKPREVRTWRTELVTSSITAGQYCVYAEYLLSEQLLHWAENAPKDRALLAKDRIVAVPLSIEVR